MRAPRLIEVFTIRFCLERMESEAIEGIAMIRVLLALGIGLLACTRFG